MVRGADTAASSTTRASSNASCSWHIRQVVLMIFACDAPIISRARKFILVGQVVNQVVNLPPIIKLANAQFMRSSDDNLHPEALCEAWVWLGSKSIDYMRSRRKCVEK